MRAQSDVYSAAPITPTMMRSWLTPDSGPLRVSCQTQEYSQWMRVTRTVSFDGQGRVAVLFLAVGEAVGATMFALHSRGRAESWVAAGVMGADAMVAGVYGIAQPNKYESSYSVAPWVPVRSERCPPGTVISAAGRSVPVDPSGLPQGDVAEMIRWVLQTGGTISVSVGGRTGTWNPDAQARCELARQIQHPQAAWFCPPVAAPPRAGPPSAAPPSAYKPGRITIEVGGSVNTR